MAQSAGALTVTVNRVGGSSGAASVQYATAGGTAVSGSNFTAASGTLTWASGDAASKTFSVPISNTTPFTGTKSFSIALSAATGASMGTPSSDAVTITGTGVVSSGGSAPSAPGSLTMTSQSLNSISLSWSAAAPGAASIAHYNIYRNGAAYATATGTTFTDAAAINANSPNTNIGPTYAKANTIYAYAVSAVDSAGNEGPQQANMTYWVYYNGVFDWAGDYSYPAGGIHINYADTTGAPEEGPYDISVSSSQSAAGFLPFAGKTVTQWDLEAGAFNYLSFDMKPTRSGQDWEIYLLSRTAAGDVIPWAMLGSLKGYGNVPAAVGQWQTYKIPLSVFTLGFTNFTASISGNSLIVSGVSSGVGVDSGGFVTGAGVPAGTYIIGNGPGNGKAGSYTIAGPGINGGTSVASTAMVEQHTGVYKFGLVDRDAGQPGSNLYYIDNIRFTVD